MKRVEIGQFNITQKNDQSLIDISAQASFNLRQPIHAKHNSSEQRGSVLKPKIFKSKINPT